LTKLPSSTSKFKPVTLQSCGEFYS